MRSACMHVCMRSAYMGLPVCTCACGPPTWACLYACWLSIGLPAASRWLHRPHPHLCKTGRAHAHKLTSPTPLQDRQGTLTPVQPSCMSGTQRLWTYTASDLRLCLCLCLLLCLSGGSRPARPPACLLARPPTCLSCLTSTDIPAIETSTLQPPCLGFRL